jgi:SAM-dependent methyltransferase
MIKYFIKRIKNLFLEPIDQNDYLQNKIQEYINNNRYNEHKWQQIKQVLGNAQMINKFKQFNGISDFGVGIDERIIEYPWIIANLKTGTTSILDAGSTFNHKIILENPVIKTKNLSIFTYYPELINFNDLRVSYIYSDLRDIPFRNQYFEEIVCHSTLEHIAMDNSMYGYSNDTNLVEDKNYEYLKVVDELNRVLKQDGILLITVPYGCFENHGFFQQFDKEMIDQIKTSLTKHGTIEDFYFKYNIGGWAMSTKKDCDNCKSYNPHTGVGKGTDNAAHSRGICCLKFTKNNI